MNVDPAPAAAATLARRLGSACYEIVLLAAIVFAAGWIFLAVEQLLPRAFARPLLQLYLLGVCAVYFIYCWTHGGQTIGMLAWRLRVEREDGTALDWRLALWRFGAA